MIGAGLGCKSATFFGNNGGSIIGACKPDTAAANSVPNIEGKLHTVSIGADTTANIITIRDGIDATGPIIFKIVTPTATVPQNFVLDIQCVTGLFIAISGTTTPTITVTYK